MNFKERCLQGKGGIIFWQTLWLGQMLNIADAVSSN
jgi:hypothetical protein